MHIYFLPENNQVYIGGVLVRLHPFPMVTDRPANDEERGLKFAFPKKESRPFPSAPENVAGLSVPSWKRIQANYMIQLEST